MKGKKNEPAPALITVQETIENEDIQSISLVKEENGNQEIFTEDKNEEKE